MEQTVGVLFDYYDDNAYLYALEKLVDNLWSDVGARIITHERPPINSRYRICIDFKIRYSIEQTSTEED